MAGIKSTLEMNGANGRRRKKMAQAVVINGEQTDIGRKGIERSRTDTS